ncbi:biliverdin-producing heme oxygenase [Kingella negevensis]|uniref:biliverdin-producing heme oxygenase n=1 Tax=Kingella negevensis TaxID=1522312 RepID=UPI002543E7C8|nr:biliverdin-producing heme oxygenase [Kingella negevensis]MDK4684868.1 biliverdin-producing heme oxygenase [Kingella negevensis]MDK4707772.1 biliverdin-producing heme oxygenase [Kingella negevensis]MDK4709295.1 biliverdin-producing heme oxygenase [Kingella negevensis]WII93809.1 biliverdin-producing heme oxygenase [Kingella negevensis]
MNEIFNVFLKENSRATHDSVDELVMSVKPFDSKENYIKFLQLQAIFHRIVDKIYKDPALNQKIPNLAELARYDAVCQDLQDLNAQEKTVSLAIPQPEGLATLGWLYCAEGSNVGAAFLYKDAQNNLGFTSEHGARHLAAHSEGRGKHWRGFAEQMNQLNVPREDWDTVLQGSLDAFAFYKKLVREIFELS